MLHAFKKAEAKRVSEQKVPRGKDIGKCASPVNKAVPSFRKRLSYLLSRPRWNIE